MRIAFVTNNYTPYSGGVVSSIQATVAELQKQGHEVCVITLSFLPLHRDDPSWVHRIPSLVRFQYKQNHCAIPWRPGCHMQRYFEQFKPDVLHLNHPFLLGPIAVRWAKKNGINTVFTHHTFYEQYSHYIPLVGRLLKPFIQPYVIRFCRRVDQLIAPSSAVKQLLSTHGVSQVAIIPSAILPIFSKQPFIKKDLKEPYRLLYVGRFAKEKNISFLFELLKKLPEEYELTLVGYGSETERLMRAAYEQHAFSKQRVRFIIKPPKNELKNLYSRAHFFTFPSQTDTQGLVLAESMACSTPVIAVDGPGQRDIIDGSNGLIVSDTDAMANALQSIHAAQYENMQRDAYETAQRYRVEQLVKKLVALYQ